MTLVMCNTNTPMLAYTLRSDHQGLQISFREVKKIKEKSYQFQSVEYEHHVTCFPLTVPGANEVSPSQKPRSRGLFQSLLCCLCRRETEPHPLKNNAALPIEENGALSKVSKSFNILPRPPSLFPVISAPPSPSPFEQHAVCVIDSGVMRETHVFSAPKLFMFTHLPCAERQWTSGPQRTPCSDIYQDKEEQKCYTSETLVGSLLQKSKRLCCQKQDALLH